MDQYRTIRGGCQGVGLLSGYDRSLSLPNPWRIEPDRIRNRNGSEKTLYQSAGKQEKTKPQAGLISKHIYVYDVRRSQPQTEARLANQADLIDEEW